MSVRSRRRAAGVGSAFLWADPILHLLSIPGYIADGASWATVLQDMTPLQIMLALAGTACAAYAFWPRRAADSILTPDQLFELEKLDRERKKSVTEFLKQDWAGLVMAVVISIGALVTIGVLAYSCVAQVTRGGIIGG